MPAKKTLPRRAPGKQRVKPTPFLDAWRPAFLAATDGRGAQANLARFLVSQGRRTLRSNHNLIAAIRADTVVPNAEDFLAIGCWMNAGGHRT